MGMVWTLGNTNTTVLDWHGIITVYAILHNHVDGSVQDCSNSSALAMELLQSCTKPSMHKPLDARRPADYNMWLSGAQFYATNEQFNKLVWIFEKVKMKFPLMGY